MAQATAEQRLKFALFIIESLVEGANIDPATTIIKVNIEGGDNPRTLVARTLEECIEILRS